jgi:hypothetical protein
MTADINENGAQLPVLPVIGIIGIDRIKYFIRRLMCGVEHLFEVKHDSPDYLNLLISE